MTDRLNEREKIAALILLLCHILLFPVLINLFQLMHPGVLSVAQCNLLYYCVSAALSVAFLGRFILRSSRKLFSDPKNSFKAIFFGALIVVVLSFVCTYIVRSLGISGTDPNSESVITLMESERTVMLVITVLLAPFVEELLFRGGIFCALYEKGRLTAYVITVLLFSLYHVWQSAFASGDIRYLLYALAYIPPSVALCYVYEKSDCIALGIIFHMGYNLAAQLISR